MLTRCDFGDDDIDVRLGTTRYGEATGDRKAFDAGAERASGHRRVMAD
jgi:hypothetical protein